MKINSYKKYLSKSFHPMFFDTLADLHEYQNCKNFPIEEITDDYLTHNDCYSIILFNDYRDFGEFATKEDAFYTELFVKHDKESNDILGYFANGQFCDAVNYLDSNI